MGKDTGDGRLSAALDEVERQVRSMARSEILGDEDLEWSIGAVFVAAQVRSSDPLKVELEASQGTLLRSSLRRDVTLPTE
jgi:hypothetical protein